MKVLLSDPSNFERNIWNPKTMTVKFEPDLECRKKQVMKIRKPHKQAGKVNQRSLLEEKLSIFRDSFPDQWNKGDVELWAQKLYKEPEPFNSIMRVVRSKCIVVPSLERSLNSPVIGKELSNKAGYHLIALDNLKLSYSLSNIFDKIRESLEKKHELETFLLQQRNSFLQHRNEQLQQENLACKEVLGKVKIKLVRNVYPSAAIEKNMKLADAFAENIIPVVDELRNKGHSTYRDIADQLNGMGLKTRGGKNWSATAVMRVDKRTEVFEEEELTSNVNVDRLTVQ